MSRFKLLLAVSADGFVARSHEDIMDWTGKKDKFLFRLLTTIEPNCVLLVGHVTAALLPPLPNREVVALSRDYQKGLSLSGASQLWPSAWLIGGAAIAEAALKANLVERAYICRNKAVLGDGIPFAPIEALLGERTMRGQLEDVTLDVHWGINHGA